MGFSFNPSKLTGGTKSGAVAGMSLLDPMDVTGVGARAAGDAQRDAAEKYANAVKQAGDAAAQAIRDANAANLAAQKEATEAAIKAAYEANTRALQAVEGANRVAEQAVQAGVDTSNATFQAAYNEIKQNLTPWVDTGLKANDQIQKLMFGTPEERKNALALDPGYQFRMDQGTQALQRAAASAGNLASGNTLIELTKFGQDYGSSEFDKAFSRLMNLSSQGQAATNSLNQYGWNLGEKKAAGAMTIANTKSQNAMNYANAAGQGEWNVANAKAGGAQNNASVSIAGQNALANSLGQGAYNYADALGNMYNADAGATIYEINKRKENASNFINTVASLYGAKSGGGASKGSGNAMYNYNDPYSFSSDGKGNYYQIN